MSANKVIQRGTGTHNVYCSPKKKSLAKKRESVVKGEVVRTSLIGSASGIKSKRNGQDYDRSHQSKGRLDKDPANFKVNFEGP